MTHQPTDYARSEWERIHDAPRRRSGLIATACFLALAGIVVCAWMATR